METGLVVLYLIASLVFAGLVFAIGITLYINGELAGMRWSREMIDCNDHLIENYKDWIAALKDVITAHKNIIASQDRQIELYKDAIARIEEGLHGQARV